MLVVDEKKQLEAEGQGNEKAYHIEAKNLLDVVISKNKDEKAVHPLPSQASTQHMLTALS